MRERLARALSGDDRGDPFLDVALRRFWTATRPPRAPWDRESPSDRGPAEAEPQPRGPAAARVVDLARWASARRRDAGR